MNKQMNIGWAQTDITPDRPVYVHGQLYTRISTYVHDPLTATCLVLENGEEQMTFVSLDMVSAPAKLAEEIRKRLKVQGLDPQKINFNAIHTHNSTRWGVGGQYESRGKKILEITGKDLMEKMPEPENLLCGQEADEYFFTRILQLIEDAWNMRSPGGISYAADYAAIAFNRRPQFLHADGTKESKMYGTCSEDSFVGFEGPSDHTVDMLYTWDLAGNLTGVAVDVPCPSQVYELHCFLSADYWGEARTQIREGLGNVFVLPLCGAAGDQNPLDLVRLSKTNAETLKRWNAQADEVFRNFDMLQECQDIGARICEAVVRGCRKAKNYIQTRPVFKYTSFNLETAIRKVTREDYEEAVEKFKAYCANFSETHKMSDKEATKLFEPEGVINRWERQNKNDKFVISSHVVRLGDVAFTTVPFELFVEYGMRIRAKDKATQTFIIQLSSNHQDSGGYLPTHAAIAGGSYSSKPASTVVGPEAGDALADTCIKAIDSLF